jgi:WD40 repeat protein
MNLVASLMMMNFEEALKITDTLVFSKTGKHLSDAQRAVIQGTWYCQKYHEIALEYRCTPEYLKQDVGPKLWKLLSDELGEKVTKKNFRTVLERRTLVEEKPGEVTEVEDIGEKKVTNTQPSTLNPQPLTASNVDWGEATDVSQFYGRIQEFVQLKQWILQEKCRLIAVLGMGGIGKTSLSVQLAQKIYPDFEFVIWRSLRNSPPLTEILRDLMQFLSDETELELSSDSHRQISQLIDFLRHSRCLIILDNAESILQEGNRVGRYYPGYENYGELFKRLGETHHQSCLLITSREKPREIAALEGQTLKVRSLPLLGLEPENCQEIIQNKGVSGSWEEGEKLIERYAGNPLALKIVTTTIYDLFDGNISNFLDQIKQGSAIFGDIRDLLEQQLGRISELELETMYWLAINREPCTVVDLRKDLLSVISPVELIEALESLSRRSLIEKSAGSFTQQPVVMEYMIERFIEKILQEIETETLNILNQYPLIKSQAKDYIRESQTRLILQPIVHKILSRYRIYGELNQKFKTLLERLKQQRHASGYAGGNIINLCNHLDLDLAEYDFSQLTIWQAYLQDANLQNVNFSGSDLSRSVFAKTLGTSLTVALGTNGILATGDAEGKIILWTVEDGQQLLVCQGQMGAVKSVAFNFDGTLLASGSDDESVRLWKVSTGECLNRWRDHQGTVNCVSFNLTGDWLASGSNDQTVRVWDTRSGQCVHHFTGHTDSIRAITFSPDGRTLASTSEDQTVKLWDLETGNCVRTFYGNNAWNWAVAFVRSSSIAGKIHVIASSTDEEAVRLWNVNTGHSFHTFHGHQDSVWIVVFSYDGELLASSSDDQTVRLWNVRTGVCLKTLPGLESQVCSLAFSPDSTILATGSVDRMVQLWDIQTGQRLRTLRGHRHQVWSFVLSPNGRRLASGSDDHKVRLWDVGTGRCLKQLQGHTDWVWSVAFSPDGSLVASGSYDRTVKLWDTQTGECLKTLHSHSDRIQAVTFSAEGKRLASASDDQTVKLWDVQTGELLQTLEGHERWVGSVAFSPENRILASGSNDQTIRLWDVETGNCLRVIEGHQDRIHVLTFAAKGSILVSGSYDRSVKCWDVQTGECLQTWRGEIERVQGILLTLEGEIWVSGSHNHDIRLWDIATGDCVKHLEGHSHPVWSVHADAQSHLLVSGSHDQGIKVWDLHTDECLKTLRADKPYNGLNITGVTGITTAQKVTLKALGAIDLNPERL